MQNIHNLASVNSLVKGGVNRGDIERLLLPYAKLYLKDFNESIDFENDTIKNYGYGLDDLAMVGYTRNDGTVSGGVEIVDGAMEFDGSTGYIDIADDNSLKEFSSFTIYSRFVATGNSGVWRQVVNKYRTTTGSNAGYYLGVSDNNKIRGAAIIGGVQRTAETTADIVLGKLYFAALRYDGTTLSLHIDNVLVGSTGASGSTGNDNNVLTLGAENRLKGEEFAGKIYSVNIYSEAHNDTEMTAIYQAGKDAYTPIEDGFVAGYSGRNFKGTAENPEIIYDTRYITQVSATDNRTVLNNLGAQAINYGGVMFTDTDSYSILANYRLDDVSVGQRMIARMTGSFGAADTPTLRAFRSAGDPRASRQIRNTGSTLFLAETGTIGLGWHQVSSFFGRDDGRMGIYRDGVSFGSDTLTGSVVSGSSDTIIFAINTSGDGGFIGGLQSLMVLDRPITDILAKSRYNKVAVE